MANTYSQIYMHIVFSVKGRASLITPQYEQELYSYICGACHKRKHHVHAIGGMPDHVHMLVGMNPSESVSELVRSLKIETCKLMHNHFGVSKFAWQSGFAAFSYSLAFIPMVSNYILGQKEHHRKFSFKEELERIFEKAQIEYDENTINALNALIDSHKGNAGDYQKAKEFLLSLMDSLATEFWQKGFDTAELESFKKAYDEKLSDKNKLEEEIISKANDLLVENDDFKFKKLAESIALKLTAYTNATKTEVEDLYNFFSITMNYLKDDIKNDIAKALAIMENENISGINLNNGNVLTWRIDADGRVSFKILSQEQLQLSQETIQKAKTFQNMIEIFNQREKQTNANSDKNTLQALLKDIDSKEFDEIKI